MKIDGDVPITRLAAELPGAMALFESLGLDYACAGGRSLDDAAHAEGIATDTVIASLRRLRVPAPRDAWTERPLAELTRHLVGQHHRFVREELAAVALRLSDVAATYGLALPQLRQLRTSFTRLTAIAIPHLHHEEEVVFRAIEALEHAWQSNATSAEDGVELAAEVKRLTAEHAAMAGELRTMRELRVGLSETNDLPAACNRVLDDLQNLEAHLHEYMFLENCVLFPRALAVEDQMAADPIGTH